MTNDTLKLTKEQRQRFEEDGFFLIEEALAQREVDELIAVTDELYEKYLGERSLGHDEPFQMRNIVARHELFLRLIDHPRILPLVVDVMGINVQIRTAHMDVRPPQSPEDGQQELGAPDGFFPWHSDRPDYGWPTIDGAIPFMEIKVGYYLTDLTEHNRGAICVVRGSHRHPPWIEVDGRKVADPERVFEVNVPPGTAMIWRTALLHCLTPNLSKQTRKCLYYGYQHRWIRPSDYDHQDALVLAGCNPIQRQLLGELGTGETNYMGDDPMVYPVSRYWRPRDEDIPLKAWAKAQRGHLSEE